MNIVRTLFRREFRPKPLAAADDALRSFSLTERIVFFSIAGVMALSAFALFSRVHEMFVVDVPRQDGGLAEGVVGSPRFVNPLLATTDADRDMVALVYAGLLRANPDGSLVPELAASYEVIDNGASYLFTLREDATFHDGEPVTADDVIFTIEKAKDQNLKSPKWANWNDVTVEKIDERTVKLAPKGVYAPFLQNATLGILPKHLWKNVTVDQFPFSPLNIEPVGAGPYRVTAVERSKNGVPSAFTLRPFNDYVLGSPYIRDLSVRFYPNESDLLAAFTAGEIEAMSAISPELAVTLANDARVSVIHAPLLRVFGVYFNTGTNDLFAAKEVRAALTLAADKERIVSDILKGYATAVSRPIPPGLLPATTSAATATTTEGRIAAGRAVLEKAGWKLSTTTNIYEKKTKTATTVLTFTLSLPNAPELKAAADILVETWKALGANVELAVYEPGDLHQNVIRPRKYDALLFGQVIGRDLDLYPFWHSSQRNDPGYNVSLYANVQTDKLLEEARRTIDPAARTDKYLAFERELAKDVPAVFLYAPDFIYVVPRRIQNANVGAIAVAAERFSAVQDWYISTDRIWAPLAKKLGR